MQNIVSVNGKVARASYDIKGDNVIEISMEKIKSKHRF